MPVGEQQPSAEEIAVQMQVDVSAVISWSRSLSPDLGPPPRHMDSQALASDLLSDGSSILMSAPLGGDPNIVEAQTQAGGYGGSSSGGRKTAVLADINKPNHVTGQRPLHVATHLGNRLAVRALIFFGADVNATVDPPPFDGSSLCSVPKMLLRGMTALHWAALRGYLEIAQDLIMSGADLNARVSHSGETALHLAARHRRKAVVGVLLDAGAEPLPSSRYNLTPMDLAAMSNNRGTLGEFLDRGIDPNSKNALGYSAVHQAAYNNSSDTLQLLLESGGSANSATDAGFTPLHVAAAYSTRPLAARPASGSNDEELSTSGTAVAASAVSAVRFIACFSGDQLLVDAVDDNGSTPLRTACIYLQEQAVRDLLDIGADETLATNLSPDEFVKDTDIIGDDGGEHSSSTPAGGSAGDRAESIARIMAMLAGAPADRAWRRRGWLVVLRTRATAAAPAAAGIDGNSLISSKGSRLSRLKARRTFSDVGRVVDGDEAKGKARKIIGGWAGTSASRWDERERGLAALVGRATELADEGVFRRIVLYL